MAESTTKCECCTAANDLYRNVTCIIMSSSVQSIWYILFNWLIVQCGVVVSVICHSTASSRRSVENWCKIHHYYSSLVWLVDWFYRSIFACVFIGRWKCSRKACRFYREWHKFQHIRSLRRLYCYRSVGYALCYADFNCLPDNTLCCLASRAVLDYICYVCLWNYESIRSCETLRCVGQCVCCVL